MVDRTAINRSRAGKISEGKTIAEPLAETKVFPPMVVQMIGVGEQTGAMDAMLQKIADFYETRWTTRSRPDLADRAAHDGLPGRSVGGIVIAMYLPIFNMANLIT